MWNKIFLVILVASVLAMLVLTYALNSWLGSITDPNDVVRNYNSYNNIYWSLLWISSLLLLIIANVVLWTRRSSWALWVSLGYFAVFITVQMWWLAEKFFQFKKQNFTIEETSFFGPIFGVILCIAVAVGIFFDQFLLTRMRDKVHGNPELAAETKNENELNISESENRS